METCCLSFSSECQLGQVGFFPQLFYTFLDSFPQVVILVEYEKKTASKPDDSA